MLSSYLKGVPDLCPPEGQKLPSNFYYKCIPSKFMLIFNNINMPGFPLILCLLGLRPFFLPS